MRSDNYYFTDYSPHHNALVPAVTGLNSGKRIVRHRKGLWVGGSPGIEPFGTLPDDALLEIFHFYVDELTDKNEYWDQWRTLVHVCQRWRNVVFESPRRLDLRLVCKFRSPVKEMLNIWPELPIFVNDFGNPTVEEADNVVAALELTDRVTRIFLQNLPNSAMERFVAAMQVPFPALTHLDLGWDNRGDIAPVISDEFLGGSAPHLRSLCLYDISFPALPKLLLSATDLFYLDLLNIPHSAYISPEEMVTCLSALTRLETLLLSFRSPRSRPSQASRPPSLSTRAVLPSLTLFRFRGITEYLEDLVARIDAPLLKTIEIMFFNQLIFDILQLPKFLSRTSQFAVFNQANVVLAPTSISVRLSSLSGRVGLPRLDLIILCSKLERQLSSLPQVCASIFSPLSHLERLDIREYHYSPLDWQDDMENSQWLELLQPFATVKDLHISKEVVSRLARALHELSGEQATEVLPSLQNLYLNGPQPSGPVQEAIGQFVAARQLSGQPVAIHHLE